MRALTVLLLHVIVFCHAMENKDLDRFIITCHTTDFECFKRQYTALRDNVLFGNQMLGIPRYEASTFKYGNSSTCVKLSGLEESKLVGISMDSMDNEYSIVLEMPFKINQVANESQACAQPDHEFVGVGPHEGTFRNFTGNATVQISFPFKLHKKQGLTFINLQAENVDLTLEIPDSTYFNRSSTLEEWAYSVMRHINAAEHCILPLSTQLRVVMEQLPLQRFLLLYPEEEYTDLNFKLLP